MSKPTITTIEDALQWLKTNTPPLYFISPTNFNLLGMDEFLDNLTYINLINCFDDKHPNVTIPKITTTPVFESLEHVNEYLLNHKDIQSKLKKDRKNLPKNAPKSAALFLFYNTDIETYAKRHNLNVLHNSSSLMKEIDNKIITTQIGNDAGVSSVPNALKKVDSYKTLRKIANNHELGDKLVIQTAYGDSGKTTFFITTENDYNKVADQIESEPKVKIMKQIRCIGTAQEACTTSNGTYVGPLMTELIGEKTLTPYKGGWCGNELLQDNLSDDIRQQAQENTEKIGNQLRKKGYRGYFEIDYLIDIDTNTVYLGELNPRITGITAITNLSHFCQTHFPLLLFHLLEFLDVDLKIDPKTYNEKSLQEGAQSISSQLIFKYTSKDLKVITKAPKTGVYTIKDGKLTLKKTTHKRTDAKQENEAFLLRIMDKGEYIYKGADYAILFYQNPIKTPADNLTSTTKNWIKAVRESLQARDLTKAEQDAVDRYQNPGRIKGFE